MASYIRLYRLLKPIGLPSEGPIWRAEDVGSGAVRSLSGLSRPDGLRLLVSGGVLAFALLFLRRQLVSSRACSDCGYMVEWSQLMWRPMLCARCLPYKLSGKQRTMWTWSHFKGVRRERFRLNFGRVLGLALPGFDHAAGQPIRRGCIDAAGRSCLDGACWWACLGRGSERLPRLDDGGRVSCLLLACSVRFTCSPLFFVFRGNIRWPLRERYRNSRSLIFFSWWYRKRRQESLAAR